jgi:5-(carboxyamino)imidazole ribonucleotide synthase
MASSRSYPVARVGIVGGGQLARMMAAAAKRLGCTVTVLDPTPDAPAASLADRHIQADYFDAEALRRLVEASDVTTYDLENVGAETLQALTREGHRVVPDPALLALIQDKRRQKAAFREHGIPTADFALVEDPSPEAFADFGYPLVQKAGRGGYDGKGVAVLQGPQDWDRHLPVAGLVERFVQHRAELAVLVARGHDGDTRVYPVVEMVFLEGANVLDLLLAPARLDDTTAQRARDTARRAVEALGGVGVFGVELFWTVEGNILVNEISPRTHNSGHYTIEACDTDQFEQHLRAVIGLPLGDTRQHTPAALLNLLGEPGDSGTPRLEGLDESLAIDGVHVHWYGKATTKPYRKMGHVTVLDPILEQAAEKAQRVKGLLRIHAAGTGPSAEGQHSPS